MAAPRCQVHGSTQPIAGKRALSAEDGWIKSISIQHSDSGICSISG
jgi:hypothetical protein